LEGFACGNLKNHYLWVVCMAGSNGNNGKHNGANFANMAPMHDTALRASLDDATQNQNLIMHLGLNTAVRIEDAGINFFSATVHYGKGGFAGGKILPIRAPGSHSMRIAYFIPFAHYARLRDTTAAQGDVFPPYTNRQMVLSDIRLVFMNNWDLAWPAKAGADGAQTQASMLYVRPLVHAVSQYSIGVYQKGIQMEASTAMVPLFSYLDIGTETRGAKVFLSPNPRRAPFPQDKAVANYAQSMLEKKIAVEQHGADEVLYCNQWTGTGPKEQIIETSGQTPAIYDARTDTLILPPREDGRLDGTSMRIVSRIARLNGVSVVQRPITVSDVLKADLFFLTGNATGGVRVGVLAIETGGKIHEFEIGTPAGREFFNDIVEGSFKTRILKEGSKAYGNFMVSLDDVFTDRHIEELRSTAEQLKEMKEMSTTAMKRMITGMNGKGSGVVVQTAPMVRMPVGGVRPGADLDHDRIYRRRRADIAPAGAAPAARPKTAVAGVR
jgi:branched-subunit amino acid aminotransferase/4-amino-4-deoxychorismate lyase